MNRGLIFCRPCRGWLRFVVLPTVSPWATFWRASGALAAMILFFAAGATAETTNTLSDAGIQGRNLAQQLLQQSPATNFSQNGVLKIRDVKGTTTNIPVSFRTFVATGSWQTSYFSMQTNDYGFPWIKLDIIHRNDEPNEYDISEDKGRIGRFVNSVPARHLHDNQIMMPFMNSDFWIADLGLEFFHWPEQKILKKEFRRNCSCAVLESTNPYPSPNGYSRVVSWIDEDSGGIVMADAYDAQGKLLKEFYPKDVKKVNGQWQVQSMEMDNVQTGSRTRLEFDLTK